MGKAILGFAAGVALTSVAFLSLDELNRGVRSSGASLQSPDSGSSVVDGDEGNIAPDSLPTPPNDYQAVSSVETLEDSRSTIEELEERLVSVAHDRGAILSELRQARAMESRQNWDEIPALYPNLLPPEFNWLSKMAYDQHEYIQREAVDPIWSIETEAEIDNYLDELPELKAKYGEPIVNCHTTICEIAFVAYGLEESPFNTKVRIEQSTASVADQSWADQFWFGNNNWFSILVNKQDGATTIVWYFTKVDQPDNLRPD